MRYIVIVEPALEKLYLHTKYTARSTTESWRHPEDDMRDGFELSPAVVLPQHIVFLRLTFASAARILRSSTSVEPRHTYEAAGRLVDRGDGEEYEHEVRLENHASNSQSDRKRQNARWLRL